MSTTIRFDSTSLIEGNTYTNAEIMKNFKVGNMGGMRKSNTQNALILISTAEDSSSSHAYNDYFDDEGVLQYTGMGQIGDQKYTQGNKALGESTETGITVHMFMKHGTDNYIYRGIVSLVGKVYKEIEPDKDGNLRMVYKFPLQLHSAKARKESTEKSAEVEQVLEKRAKDMDLETLFAENEKILEKINANERLGNVKSKSTSTRIRRDPKVATYVIARARGKCQLCGVSIDPDDLHKPGSLVCHHESPLKEGGRDDKLHAAALCPNCHDRRHSGSIPRCVIEKYISIINLNIRESEERVRRELQDAKEIQVE